MGRYFFGEPSKSFFFSTFLWLINIDPHLFIWGTLTWLLAAKKLNGAADIQEPCGAPFFVRREERVKLYGLLDVGPFK